jgi:hypothetical protein
VRCEVVRLPELNTFGEIWGLCAILRQRAVRHVLIVSSHAHLRRIRYAVRKLTCLTPVHITYVGVPVQLNPLHGYPWRGHEQGAWLVITEWLKLAGYHIKYGVFRRHLRYEYQPF